MFHSTDKTLVPVDSSLPLPYATSIVTVGDEISMAGAVFVLLLSLWESVDAMVAFVGLCRSVVRRGCRFMLTVESWMRLMMTDNDSQLSVTLPRISIGCRTRVHESPRVEFIAKRIIGVPVGALRCLLLMRGSRGRETHLSLGGAMNTQAGRNSWSYPFDFVWMSFSSEAIAWGSVMYV